MVKNCTKKHYIFTGTPGSGKTSVLQALKQIGYTVVPEAATDLITDFQKKGVMQPWTSPCFIEAIVSCQKKRQLETKGYLQFYDRSPFCTLALEKYLKFQQVIKLKKEIDRCLKNNIYQNTVFFFENLGFIERTDVRKISYEEALIFEKIHLETYQEFGFNIIVVPKSSIEERMEFVLGAI